MATSSHRFSKEAAFVLATEALYEAATIKGDGDNIAFAPGFGPVRKAIVSYCRHPGERSRAQFERAATEFRAMQRATALARWRGKGGENDIH